MRTVAEKFMLTWWGIAVHIEGGTLISSGGGGGREGFMLRRLFVRINVSHRVNAFPVWASCMFSRWPDVNRLILLCKGVVRTVTRSNRYFAVWLHIRLDDVEAEGVAKHRSSTRVGRFRSGRGPIWHCTRSLRFPSSLLFASLSV